MEQKTKNTRSLIAIIIFLLFSNIAILVFFLFLGGNDKPSRGHDHNGMQDQLKKEVGFDQKQLDSYQQLRENHMKKIKPLFDDIRSAKDSFYALLYLDQPSDSVINSAAIKIGDKQEVLDKEVFSHFKSVRMLSHPDQLPKFDSLFKKVIEKITGRGRKSK